MMLNNELQKKLEGEYTVVVKDYQHRVKDDGKENIKIDFRITEGDETGREFNYVMFPTQLDYVMSCLRKQFDLENKKIKVAEVLEHAKEISFKVWVSYNTYGRNVAFHNADYQEPAPALEDVAV